MIEIIKDSKGNAWQTIESMEFDGYYLLNHKEKERKIIQTFYSVKRLKKRFNDILIKFLESDKKVIVIHNKKRIEYYDSLVPFGTLTTIYTFKG